MLYDRLGAIMDYIRFRQEVDQEKTFYTVYWVSIIVLVVSIVTITILLAVLA